LGTGRGSSESEGVDQKKWKACGAAEWSKGTASGVKWFAMRRDQRRKKKWEKAGG